MIALVRKRIIALMNDMRKRVFSLLLLPLVARALLPRDDAVAVTQAAAQDSLDMGLCGDTIRVGIGADPLGTTGATPAPHQRPAAEQGRLPGERVATVAIARGIDAAQPDV